MTMAQKGLLPKVGHSSPTDKALFQNHHQKKKTLNMTELSEYYKHKKLHVGRFPRQSHRKQTLQSRPHKLKLPSIAMKSRKDVKSTINSKEVKLPQLPPKKEPARRKETVVIVSGTKPTEKTGGIAGNCTSNSKKDNIDNKNGSRTIVNENIHQEVKSELEPQNLQPPIVDNEEPTNIPKQRTRMSQSEYSKQIKSRRKLAWKAQREKAKLFNIDLVDLHRSMLTSSATMRGLMKLNASEVVIYRFRLSNYDMIDIQY